MELKDKIINHFKAQKSLINEYETLLDEYVQSDIQKENEDLKRKIENLNRDFEELQSKHRILSIENSEVKLTLKEQIIDEKTNILKISKAKINTYFEQAEKSKNILLELEHQLKEEISNLQQLVKKKFYTNKNESLSEIEELSVKLNKRLKDQIAELERDELTIADKLKSGYEELQNTDVDNETMEKRRKQNKLELKIGLNIFNKLGVLLILIAIGIAAKYSYSTWFNDYAKGILFFGIGIIMLALGEFFYRKNSDVFSRGLIGGGIAALYSATFFSYFILEIFNLNSGLIFLLLITIIAIILSIRYNSKIIGTFALVGGYIPFITMIINFTIDDSFIYAAMIYLFVLNLTLLLISFWKNWKLTNFTSFFLNIPCLVYLILNVSNVYIAIAYSVVTFLMYLTVNLSYPLRFKIKLKSVDIFLLAINTILSCGIMYTLFNKHDLQLFRGFLALIFALSYLGLGLLISKKMEKEKESMLLFYGTSLTFVVLMIPFQFGVDWLSMGWLVEGLILTILGLHYKMEKMELAGWIIFGISLSTFFFFDLLEVLEKTPFMEFKFTMVILSTISVLLVYLFAIKNELVSKYSQKYRIVQGFKIFTIVTFYLYSIYMTNYAYGELFLRNNLKPILSGKLVIFFNSILVALVHVLLAIVLPKIKIIYSKSVKIISISLNVISILICIVLTMTTPVFNHVLRENRTINFIALIILIAFNAITILRVREITISVISKNKFNFEYYPIILSTYLLSTLTSILVFQFNLASINLIISFLFLFFAIGNIAIGFFKKYTYIRLMGLVLTLFSTGKLFLWDLRYLSTGGKIIAYFGFGFVLILISFIYQKMKKEADKKYVKEA